MTIEQIKRLREEEDHVEFKEARTQYTYGSTRKSVLGYVVALANEKGGKLIFGVKESKGGVHHIVGSAAWQGNEGKLEQEIYRDLKVRVETEVLHEEGKRVLIIHVPSRPVGKVLKFEDVPLMRVGEDLHSMSDEQFYKILQEQEPDFSARFCDGLTIDDLDLGAIDKMKEQYAIKQKNPSFKDKSNEQVLNDLGLIEEGRLTYAALILLGRKKAIQQHLSHASVIWEFRFNEGQISHDFREEVCLPLFIGITHLWNLINGKNGDIPIREGAYINTLPTFNEEVIREAVLNAIAHRDYSITSSVVVRQYPKKMIINNPGGFPKGVTKDNLLTISSTPRCRLMAEVLEKTGLVERSGQGVDKIFSYTISEGKAPPSYDDSDMLQVSLKLSGIMEDKMFHIFLREIQESRGADNVLGAEKIIGLYKVKSGLVGEIKRDTLDSLGRDGLVTRAGTHSNRYTLPQRYYELSSKEKSIGSRYITLEVEQFLLVLQGHALKIGELEQRLSGSLSRNQIKYLISKLFPDGIVEFEGSGKGTKYKLASQYASLSGDGLVSTVIAWLRDKYAPAS
jgi:ATP-dependent DNA helicase RecG